MSADDCLPPPVRQNAFFRRLMTKPESRRKLTWKEFRDIFINALQILLKLPLCVTSPICHKEKTTLYCSNLSCQNLLAVSNSLELGTFKQIAASYNCTVNDVFLSCVAGALKSYDTFARSFRFIVPMQVRQPCESTTQNSVSAILLDFAFNFKSRRDRLKSIATVMAGAKASPDVVIIFHLLNVYVTYLPIWIIRRVFNYTEASLVATNLRGIRQQISIAGDCVNEMFVFAPNHSSLGKFNYFLSPLDFRREQHNDISRKVSRQQKFHLSALIKYSSSFE